MRPKQLSLHAGVLEPQPRVAQWTSDWTRLGYRTPFSSQRPHPGSDPDPDPDPDPEADTGDNQPALFHQGMFSCKACLVARHAYFASSRAVIIIAKKMTGTFWQYWFWNPVICVSGSYSVSVIKQQKRKCHFQIAKQQLLLTIWGV